MVHFVGAGPGAPDLITVRGQRLLGEADLVVYTGSLVNPEVLQWAKAGASLRDSASMTLEEVMEAVKAAESTGKTTVRLHTGDPSVYGAIREQMDWLDREGISYDICPGVSSFCGAAAALQMEYTLPGISQSVVLTRMAGRTPVPERESIASFARHGATMVIFLSAGMLEQLSRQLMDGGFEADTPAALVYKATWPEEQTVYCTVGTLARAGADHGISRTALVVVGRGVAQGRAGLTYERSCLYNPSFATGCRESSAGAAGEMASAVGADVCQERGAPPGRLAVVGMGPGGRAQMTQEAWKTMERSQVIVGYTVYVELVRGLLPGKEFRATPMTRETERVREAFALCLEGRDTALVCSGDAGVYGMAGLALELAQEYPQVKVEIVPGMTAACTGAALLGAPLMHDFAVISLSDRLTPLEEIWERVESAARAGFVLCIYNPSSKGRPDYLRQACQRLRRWLPGDTVCGVASRIGREGEQAEVLTLEELEHRQTDMFSTVFIGNQTTRRIGPYMVTPRGYRYERTK